MCVAAITTAPAHACPRDVLCVIAPDRAASPEVAPAHRKPAAFPDVRKLTLAPRAHLTFVAPPKRDPSVVEMPWIWRVLREQVYSQMPSHRARNFTLTLSPIVVTTPSDSIPGVGIAGDF
ncbi:MAG TPA: hypothetical protein VIV40_44570 [Kofleriaceae bacterium]